MRYIGSKCNREIGFVTPHNINEIDKSIKWNALCLSIIQ